MEGELIPGAEKSLEAHLFPSGASENGGSTLTGNRLGPAPILDDLS